VFHINHGPSYSDIVDYNTTAQASLFFIFLPAIPATPGVRFENLPSKRQRDRLILLVTYAHNFQLFGILCLVTAPLVFFFKKVRKARPPAGVH
jgi:hypothetical protein